MPANWVGLGVGRGEGSREGEGAGGIVFGKCEKQPDKTGQTLLVRLYGPSLHVK